MYFQEFKIKNRFKGIEIKVPELKECFPENERL